MSERVDLIPHENIWVELCDKPLVICNSGQVVILAHEESCGDAQLLEGHERRLN